MQSNDYYALLGVRADADDEELRRAWRQISAAYAVLSDPIARAAYDRHRRAAEPERSSAPPLEGATTAPRTREPAPAIQLWRISGSLTSMLTRGVARLDEPGCITLVLRKDEAAQGGMATVSLDVELWCPACGEQEHTGKCMRCGGRGTIDELFSAWLAIPPGVTTGEMLAPSVELPNMVEPVRFRVRVNGAT